jgi:hypothetical protein
MPPPQPVAPLRAGYKQDVDGTLALPRTGRTAGFQPGRAGGILPPEENRHPVCSWSRQLSSP